jgi:hypothetical protein
LEDKKALYAGLAKALEEECRMKDTDLMVSISINTKEDWSFRQGKALFV